jgi:hypothetical protein
MTKLLMPSFRLHMSSIVTLAASLEEADIFHLFELMFIDIHVTEQVPNTCVMSIPFMLQENLL